MSTQSWIERAHRGSHYDLHIFRPDAFVARCLDVADNADQLHLPGDTWGSVLVSLFNLLGAIGFDPRTPWETRRCTVVATGRLVEQYGPKLWERDRSSGYAVSYAWHTYIENGPYWTVDFDEDHGEWFDMLYSCVFDAVSLQVMSDERTVAVAGLHGFDKFRSTRREAILRRLLDATTVQEVRDEATRSLHGLLASGGR